MACAASCTSREQGSKLESLGVLAAGIAHDFNNLLGGLFGHLDLARAQLDADSAARSHLDFAQEAFERAKALTGQLLAFAKGGAPLRKVGSLAASVMQCTGLALSGSNVNVEFDLEPGLWNAEFDSNQLAQAVGRRQAISAALLDLTVRSGAGGRDIVSPLRTLLPCLPIIASSGYSDDPIMADPAHFGFTASLPKPFRINEFGELLARFVRGE